MRRLRVWILLLAVLACALPAGAHVGNKDVFEEVTAGPYKLFVTIRTPIVIPGVATIEVRSSGAPVNSILISPLLLTGEASKHPPTPDGMRVSADDKSFFTGSLWLMGTGSWLVRFTVTGVAGTAVAAVPVPAAPTQMLKMQRPMGMLLGGLGLMLVLGMVGIAAAAVREARLEPGVQPDGVRRRRALVGGALTLVFACAAVYLGGKWWNVEAADYAKQLNWAAQMHPELKGGVLNLSITYPDGRDRDKIDTLETKDLLPDHGHLMHLYAIREPEMDAAFHLHPAAVGETELSEALPAMPAGHYKLYGDIVMPSGFAETVTGTMMVPAGMHGTALSAEDASAAPPPLSAGELGATYKLPGGYSMAWEKPAEIKADTAYAFRFTLLDPSGKPAADVVPYLGMAGHAAFVKTDGTAFAHTHPEGSAAMPAMMLANAGEPDAMAMDTGPKTLPPVVEFPYGFPSAGRYRIFIQMKHGSTVETGVFDAEVK
jgi:hypothetical protein